MKSPLDRKIKEHFQGKGFDQREGDWESMYELIQEAAKASKRRKVLYWLPALLLLTTTASIWFWYPKTGNRLAISQKQEQVFDGHKSIALAQGTASNGREEISDQTATTEMPLVDPISRAENGSQFTSSANTNTYQAPESQQVTSVSSGISVDASQNSESYLPLSPAQENDVITNIQENVFEAEKSMDVERGHDMLTSLGIEIQPENLELKLSADVRIKKSIKYPNYYPNMISLFAGGNNQYTAVSNKIKSNEIESERPVYFVQGGAQYTWQRRVLGLSAGVQYSAFTSKNTYKTEDISYTFTSYLRLVNPNYSVSSSGNPIVLVKRVVDTTTTVSTRYIAVNQLSKLQYIHIPINVSFSKHTNRLHAHAGMGLSPGFLVGRSGWYSVAGNSGKVTAVDLGTYSGVRRVVWTGIYQVGVGYSITNHLQLGVRYDMSRGLSSVFKDFRETMKTESLNFGLGYGF